MALNPSLQVMLQASSNVECGLLPGRGRGFQTVALSPALAGTADLKLLEDLAAYYEVTAGRRAAGDLPVKSTYLALPSGSCAVGRTLDWGAGPGGRPGNYLARHLVTGADELTRAGGPFALDPGVWDGAAQVDPDDPREVSPFPVNTTPLRVETSTLRSLPTRLLSALAAHAVDPGDRTALLVGDEDRSLALLRELHAALPARERMQLAFSTHFYRACDALRPHFRIVTVRSWSEAPAQRQAYLAFDLDRSEHPAVPEGPYSRWLVSAVQARDDREIERVVRTTEQLRRAEDLDPQELPRSADAFAVLWALAGASVLPWVPRQAALITELLRLARDPGSLADGLLATAAPRELCAEAPSPDEAKACLTALRSAASPRNWKAWLERWNNEPLLASFRAPAWAFWKR